jgi:hypothetical protein
MVMTITSWTPETFLWTKCPNCLLDNHYQISTKDCVMDKATDMLTAFVHEGPSADRFANAYHPWP